MKVVWFVLFALAIAFLGKGSSLPLQILMEGHISPSLPLESIKHRNNRVVGDLGELSDSTHRDPEEPTGGPVYGADFGEWASSAPKERGLRSSSITPTKEPDTQSDNKEWRSGDFKGIEPDSRRDPDAIQDMDLEAEADFTHWSSGEGGFDAAKNIEPKAEEDNREWSSGDIEDTELHPGWGSVVTQGMEPEAETDDREWSSGNPKDAELGYDTEIDEWDSENSEDIRPESTTEEQKWSLSTAQDIREAELKKQADLQRSVRSDFPSVDDPIVKYTNVSDGKKLFDPKQFFSNGLKRKIPLSPSGDGDAIFIIQFPSKGKPPAPVLSKKGYENKKKRIKVSSPADGDLNRNSVSQLNSVDHGYGRATKVKKEVPEKENLVSVAGAVVGFSVIMIVLFVAFFVFAWPVRKYYTHLSKRTKNNDHYVGGGPHNEDGLISIRVDRGHPFNPPAQRIPNPPPPPPQYYQVPGGMAHRESIYNQIVWRTWADVAADDRKRDPRSAERRKIIKRETSERRDSLANSIKIAKLIIDGHSKNKKNEKKASQKRRIVKYCTSGGDNRRRMSLAEELETARSIIAPNASQRENLERSMKKSRLIKNQLVGKRRLSFSDEIGVGKKVIVDSGRRYEVPPIIVQEMLGAQVPLSSRRKSYSYSDILEDLLKTNGGQSEMSSVKGGHSKEMDELASSGIAGLTLDNEDSKDLDHTSTRCGTK